MVSGRPGDPPRVLVVAYDFPPHGAIGTMRTLRLVRALAARGWPVRVVTSDPASYAQGTPVDEALLARIPSSVIVDRAVTRRPQLRRPSWLRRPPTTSPRVRLAATPRAAAGTGARPGVLTRAVRFVDTLMTIPDKQVGWIRPAVRLGRRVVDAWSPDVLYSSAPPWSGQLVARALARRYGLPWIADFRDPWSRAPWRDDWARAARWGAAFFEHRVVRDADAILFVTRGNRDEFAHHYGQDVAAKFHLVENGCDTSEFVDLPAAPPTDRRILLHAGSLYGARNPVPLFEAVASLIDDGTLSRGSIGIRLLGNVNPAGVDVPAAVRRLGLETVVDLVSRVPRAESLAQMCQATALILVQPVTTVSVPGKAYEYLATGRPVLALADEGETADLIRASGGGVVCPPSDVGLIRSGVLEVLALASGPFSRVAPTFYDAAVQVDQVAALIEQHATRSPRRHRPQPE